MGYDMYKVAPHRGEDYYRLNIFGMGEARQALFELGIVLNVEMLEFTEEMVTLDPQLPGIPVYKLGSNDGWLVTPREIEAGIAAADALHPEGWRDGLEDHVSGFVAWMEEADSGFQVY